MFVTKASILSNFLQINKRILDKIRLSISLDLCDLAEIFTRDVVLFSECAKDRTSCIDDRFRIVLPELNQELNIV